VDFGLELVVIPVANVERAKAFYRAAGFREDFDYASGSNFRVVQFTPPGSGAAIVFGHGITDAAPGSAQGLHLLVSDVAAARAVLIARGVEVTEEFHDVGGFFYRFDASFEVPGPDPARRPHRSFARFRDPDGNGWVLEER
jgi:catechol 2,3-dioxygenase-like lactoylglutathione lyase family enzyme